MLTAYDATMARLLDRAGVDVILVGDSLGMVILGQPHTLAVTLDEMVHHTRAVARGTERALVVADMPFLTYQVSVDEAVRNAGRLLQEGGAAAVKLEGGRPVLDVVRRLVDVGIPVMGHLGLLPQSVHQLGGYRNAGYGAARSRRAARRGRRRAREAGAFAIVLEAIPADVARTVTQRVDVPTIGIGAGPDCDGQVLVSYDMLGLFDGFVPSFVKQYAHLARRDRRRSRLCRRSARRSSIRRRARRPRVADVLEAGTEGDGSIASIRSPQRLRDDLEPCAASQAHESGFVPTMGALHAGHASLIAARAARVRHASSSASSSTRFSSIGRTTSTAIRERSMPTSTCAGRHGVDLVFAPTVARCIRGRMQMSVDVGQLADHLCGRYRPGHFEGVATVVLKLLEIVQPDVAYFGEKDAQQLAIVRRLVADFNVPVSIVRCRRCGSRMAWRSARATSA